MLFLKILIMVTIMTNQERLLEHRKRHIKMGLCIYCNDPAVMFRVCCEYHLKYKIEARKKETIKRKKFFKCIRCGAPLNTAEIDNGDNVTCCNCSEHLYHRAQNTYRSIIRD